MTDMSDLIRGRMEQIRLMKKANVSPLYNQLTLHGAKTAGEESGTIARAVMTEEGLAPWTAVAIWHDFRDDDMWGMLTAPWSGTETTIAELLLKNSDIIETFFNNTEKLPTLATARKVSAHYPSLTFAELKIALTATESEYLPVVTREELRKLKPKAFCYLMAIYTYTEDNCRKMAESMFASISAMAKGGNATNDCITRRLGNFQKNAAFASMATPTPHALAKYAAKYLPSKVPAVQYCEFLRLTYISFERDNFEEGLWLIQQAPGMNCAPLSAIADTIPEGIYSYDLIASMFNVEAELQNVCESMWILIHNPFKHIRRPTHALRTYATVALLCAETKFTSSYNTTSLKSMSPHATAVLNVVASVKLTGPMSGGRDVMINALLTSYGNANVMNVNGVLMGYPSLAPPPAEGQSQGIQEQNLRTKPNPQTPGIQAIQASAILAKYRSPRDSAFASLCKAFQSATAQNILKTGAGHLA